MSKSKTKPMRLDRDNDVVHDLLLLVDVYIPCDVIARWTNRQFDRAEKWASKMYLRASDNNVRVPSRPRFIGRAIKEYSQEVTPT
ncbi:MAG: hypothetical protein IT323_13645 [Anaerolineae bacterium]|nr:hypothetical protein [Anaerolineae bacterium]